MKRGWSQRREEKNGERKGRRFMEGKGEFEIQKFDCHIHSYTCTTYREM